MEVLSLSAIGLAVFVLFALGSYRASDPSPWSTSTQVAQNWCGTWGASLSSFLLQIFGLAAWGVPVAFGFVALLIHRRENAARLCLSFAAILASLVFCTLTISLHWKYWQIGGRTGLTGGLLGTWAADVLLQSLNLTGATIVAVTGWMVCVGMATPLSLARVIVQAVTLGVTATAKLIIYMLNRLLAALVTAVPPLARFVGQVALPKSWTLVRSGAGAVGGAVVAGAKEVSGRVRALSAMKGEQDEPKVSTEAVELRSNDWGANPDPITQQNDEEPESPRLSVALAPSVAPALTALTMAARTDGGPKSGPEIIPPENWSKPEMPMTAPQPSVPPPKAARRPIGRARNTGAWKLPLIDFLRKPAQVQTAVNRDRLLENSKILAQKFADFGIQGEVTAVRPGPVITLYEFKPGPGVKVSRIAALADDLSMALSAQSVRILAPLPGKSVVGIEIPSDARETVFMREFLQHPDFHGPRHSIPVVMGKDISGQPTLSDLARMPHLLCAGQTGSGKSVFMNGLICSLFYRFTPDELRMILVDPKFIEFRSYQDIPHLLLPVVDDPGQAATALRWAVREMERRYRILAKIGARNLAAFNQKVEELGSGVVRDLLMSTTQDEESPDVNMVAAGATAKGPATDWIEAFEPDEEGVPRVGKLPYIVVIIDELADLMMVARKEVEISIARIAQKARAAGIHLIVATQRPSTDVITGLIKANLPSRVSFQLASYVDSKTILDRAGAERLLGSGDMLFIPPGVSQAVRLHGAYLSDEEIDRITQFWKGQGKPVYRDEILLASADEDEDGDEESGDDELFTQAVELIQRSGHASASFLQRHLKIGYNRAARMIETMERKGIVGPADGSRPREVLVSRP